MTAGSRRPATRLPGDLPVRLTHGQEASLDAAGHGGEGWLRQSWFDLDSRTREVLVRGASDESCADIGRSLGLSRQRVRQVQVRGEDLLLARQNRAAPDLHAQVRTLTDRQAAVADTVLRGLLPAAPPEAAEVLLRALGLRRPRVWGRELTGWWALRPLALAERLDDLTRAAPLPFEELHEGALRAGLPPDLELDELLASPGSPLLRQPWGYGRARLELRDGAYLWLRSKGEPQPAQEIASALRARSRHLLADRLRHDDRFLQVRPSGAWALTAWDAGARHRRYRSAAEAVVEVLREEGACSLPDLVQAVQARYPVGISRIRQCLSQPAVGLTTDGLLDLTERGALPHEDPEPVRPGSIRLREDGAAVTVDMTVRQDMLKGSGVTAPRWLTWYLGLRTAPASRSFRLLPDGRPLTVRRPTGCSQISSLRVAIEERGLAQGCRLELTLHLRTDTATLRHACPPADADDAGRQSSPGPRRCGT